MSPDGRINPELTSNAFSGPDLGRRLVANTAANFAGQVVILLLVFFATPYLIHHFGPKLYGVLVLLLAYIEVFALLEVGINASLVKYLAEMLPQRRVEDVNSYFGTALALFMVGGILIAAPVALSAHWVVANLLNVSQELLQPVLFGFWVASAVFFLRFVGQAFSAIPVATQRFDIVNYVNVGSESIRILGSVAVVYFGHLLEGVVIVILLATLFRCVANFLIARRLIPGLSLRPRFSPQHFRSIFHFSKFVMIAHGSGWVVHSLDKLIIGYFLPVAFVAFYDVPYALSQKLWVLVGNVTTVVFPAASALSATAPRQQLKELYLRSSKMLAALTSFPALTLCLYSRELLLYWIGPEFADQGALTLRLLSLGFLINCMGNIPYSVTQATGHPQIAARFSGLNAILNLVFFFLLIPRFGIIGAAGGFLGTQVIVIPWFVHVANRLPGVGWKELLYRSFSGVFLASILGCMALVALRPLVFSLFSLALVVGVGLGVYLALTVVIILDKKERATCFAFVDERLLSLGQLLGS